MNFKTQLAQTIQSAIDAALEANQETGHRWHLGASQIGNECRRRTWYGFRWAFTERFDARMLRLFDRGHREEFRIVEWLRAAGCVVDDVDPATGKQWKIRNAFGHFGGSLDGIMSNVPGLRPDVRVLLEFKTHNAKSFALVQAQGVHKAKPQHVEQMQTYMGAMQLPAAVYVAICKDNDEMHIEIVEYDAAQSQAIDERADAMAASDTPPPRVNDSPTFYQCRYCPAKQICHGKKTPEVNCRTCAHVSAADGGSWKCDRHGYVFTNDREDGDSEGVTLYAFHDHTHGPRMHDGCADHVFNPHMLNGVTFLGGDEITAELKMPNGAIVRNGPGHTPSTELVIA